MLPTRVGNYELIRSLGVGGMAETFEAVRRGPAGFAQRVCLKRMLAQDLQVPSAVELFLDEARLSAHLRCASIVQVYDFGEADGSYYMALELVEGENLESLQRALVSANLRLPVDTVLYIASALLSALDYAHTLTSEGEPIGIVHRDISPSNVLVSLRGEVKLTDFGIAKARGRRHRTRNGYTKGKLAYMSPEQARGEALDGRSDLFSLGIVLYELLTNRHPFESPTDLELLKNMQEARFTPLEQLAPDAPMTLRTLIERLLRPDPNRRMASAAEALQLLSFTASPYQLQQELAGVVARHRAGTDLLATNSTFTRADGSSPRPAASATVTLQSQPSAPLRAEPSALTPGSRSYNAASDTAEHFSSSGPRRGTGRLPAWAWLSLLALVALATLLAWQPFDRSSAPERATATPLRAVNTGTDSPPSTPTLEAHHTLTPAAPQAPLPATAAEQTPARLPQGPQKKAPRPKRSLPPESTQREPQDKSRTKARVTAEQFL